VALIRDINALVPEMKEKVLMFKAKLSQAKIPYLIIETLRTQDVQNAYYAQGRQSFNEVNTLRKKAGLYLFKNEWENKSIVTKTRSSYHSTGKACDLVPLLPSDTKKIWWAAPDQVWEELGCMGESCGLEWGGRWKDFIDKPHYQL
jgi:peptidoglycan L-alanyl-D-glutamate endopeptidase CwlK